MPPISGTIGKTIKGALGSLFGVADDEDPEVVAAAPSADGVVNYAPLRQQLQQQIDRLKADRGDKADMFLAFASGLGRPTKTGSFGESIGYATEALAKQSAESAKARDARRDMLMKYGIDLATLDVDEQKNILAAQARTAAANAKALEGGWVFGGQVEVGGKTYVTLVATKGPDRGSAIRVLPEEVSAYTSGEAQSSPVPATSQAAPVRAAPAAIQAPTAPTAPTAVTGSTWTKYVGQTRDGRDIGLTPGVMYQIGENGPTPIEGTGVAQPTRPDPSGVGGEQVLDPTTKQWVYKAGQSPEDQESLLRAEARQLGVPFLPPPISKNLNPAQRGAQLRTYLADGQKAMAELKADVDTSAKMAANAQQFVSINSRTTTGPVVGRVSSMIPPKDIQTLDSLTQSMKVVAPRTPGAISNYEDAGLAKAVPNKLADRATNTVLARRATAYNQLQQEQLGFATAWAQANGGSLFGMDDAWNRYKKANPIYDTSDPNRLAAALPNLKRPSWKEWGQQTYYKKGAASAPAATAPKTASTPAAAAPKGAPTVGAVKDGYRFKGGDPANAKNWEKV